MSKPVDLQPPPKKKLIFSAAMIAGAMIGSALGGGMLSGAPLMSVATSLQGSLGFTMGHVAGMLVAQDDTKSWFPLIASAAIPLVAGGVIDRGYIGVVGGGLVGIYLSGAHSDFKL